jgi:pyruvate dehydrogenase E1 component beta subunit
MAKMTMVQALNRALRDAMQDDESVYVLGEDVGVGGGIFRVTDGLIEEFGEQRVMDTPLAESAIVGFAIGMALAGLKPVAELQFSGFSYFAWHQLESHAARMRWRSQGRYTLPLVVRAPYGAGVRALEHHSESREAMVAHIPGLKMVLPSGPRNARALLLSAIADPDPVVFFEPKLNYRSIKEEVPDTPETLTLGESQIVREGNDVTLISYGAMLRRTLEAADELKKQDGVEAEVIDLMTLAPLDHEKFAKSVKKTGHAVIVHEAPKSFGPGAEVMARLIEESFLFLEAPVARVTGFDVHVPYFARERAYLPDVARIAEAARASLNF